jgi:hypothetical protein
MKYIVRLGSARLTVATIPYSVWVFENSHWPVYSNVFASMAPRNATAVPTVPHAPDSPRSSLSPPPSGVQGDLELELLGLANALYNLGTTVINDSTKEKDKPGGGKQVGLRVWVCALP